MPRLALVTLVLFSAALFTRPDSRDRFRAAEQTRVRAHLDSAEHELRAKDVSMLTASQRAARLRNLDRLHAYWVRGVFPLNTDFPDERVPYFIDRFGTRCAMAYLIEQSGHGDFVRRVAATRNNARIRGLTDDPALVAWLHESGLTVAEAARIQPAYGCCDGQCVLKAASPYCGTPGASTGYKTATGILAGADVVTVALSAAPRHVSSHLAGTLGVLTGVVGFAIGAENVDEGDSRRTVGLVNIGVGTASMALGLYRITRQNASGQTTASRVSFAPWVDARRGAGVSAQVSF